MAIIKCKACGEDVSDKAKSCPHCSATLIEKAPMICKECGAEISDGLKTCPKCGCPVPMSEKARHGLESSEKLIFSITGKNISAKAKKIIAISLAAILLLVVGIIISQNTLFGDDKIAYELVLNGAKKFKKPYSVRLTGGTLCVKKNCMFAGISAENGLGERNTSYYFITKDYITKEDDPDPLYEVTNELNLKKINKKLEKELGIF